MGYVDGKLSLAQNVDRFFFTKGSKLQNEYDRLFDSVFVNPDAVKSIVEFLSTKNAGFTRKEIIEKQELLMEEVNPKISIRSTLITTFGLEHNEYCGVFTNIILLDDLFG